MIRILVGLLTLPFLSCQGSSNQIDDNMYSLNFNVDMSSEIDVIKTETSRLKAEDFFDNIEFLPLKFDGDNFIATCDKIIINDKLYYLLDKKFGKLLVFDERGRFIRQIGNLGRGPGEFQGIQDFDINEEGNLILYSQEDMALFLYSSDGVFQSKIDVPFYASNFELIDQKSYLFYTDYNRSDISDNKNLIVTDLKLNVLGTYMPYPEKSNTISIAFSGFMKHFGDESIYNNAFSDSLWIFDKNGLAKKTYIFDFNGTGWSHGFDFMKLYEPNSINMSYITNQIFMDEEYIFTNILYKRRIRSTIIDRKDNMVYNETSFENSNILRLLRTPMAKKGARYVSYLSPETVDAIIRKNKAISGSDGSKDLYHNLANQLSNLSDINENSVLILYNLNLKGNE